ncbi:MAG: hypothetical protein CSA21_05325 [Deltaproteobacteria bacterium]|nr:MAG: hypothetical protein CSA21_05325 [Deltaproteobacteria bacterium]
MKSKKDYIYKKIRDRQNFIPDDLDGSAVGQNVIDGSFWSSTGLILDVLISFVRSIILARILAPADFGIVALAAVFTQFILIFANFGFTASVIYYRNLTKEDISTCWWGNCIVDLTASLCCTGIAFFSTRFLTTPEAPYIVALLSSQFFLASLGSTSAALLQRLFKFKAIALIKAIGALVSFVVTLSLVVIFDAGVYGLVYGGIAGTLCTTILYLATLPWLPSLCASWRVAKKHLRYGGWFLGVNLVSYVNGNMDKAVIGGFLNNTQLGYFEYATRFPSMVVYDLGMVLNRVLFSAFSSLQGNEENMRGLLKKLFRYNTLLIYPLLAGLAAVANDFTLVMYGEKWSAIILPMQILCIYGMVRVLTNPLYSLANGIGKPNMPFKWALIALPLNAIVAYIMAKFYGLEGVAATKVILTCYTLFTLGIELAFCLKISFLKLLFQAIPAIFCSFLMLIFVFFTKNSLSSLIDIRLLLGIQILSGASIYILSIRLFFLKDFNVIYNTLKGIIKK